VSIWHHVTNILNRPKPPVTGQQLRNRQIWYDALKSGKYRQTQETLVTVGPDYDDPETPDDVRAYCCLGLACEVVLGLDPVFNEDVDRWGYNVTDDTNNTVEFIADVWPANLFHETFGFDLEVASLNPNGDKFVVQNVFTEANDSDGLSFETIAELIPLDQHDTRPHKPREVPA
jgi:hypothetical protein